MLASAAACLLLAAPAAAEKPGWVPVGPPGGDVRSLAADPKNPRVVYLGTADGVLYRSDDGGAAWRRLAPGFPMRGRSLDDLVVDRDGDVLVGYWEVAGTGGGVARSSDGGRTFAVLPDVEGQSVRALAVAPSDARILVAGTLSGVFRSRDGGQSWRRVSPEGHADLRNVGSVAVDPTDPDVMYAGTWHLPWKTVDGGRHWRPIKSGMIDDSDVMTLTLDRDDPRVLYATACTGIYRSADGAGRWTKLKGIPSRSRRTRAFAVDPVRRDTLYAGTTQGFWASEDSGASWRLLTSSSLVVNAVLAQPGGTLLLGTDGAGVLRSRDGGRSWTAANDGFSERFVSRMVFDPDGRQVYAGILGDRHHGGVMVAPDLGGPWRPLGPGLEGREVLALTLAGRQPVAGTDDGIFVWSGESATAGPADPARARAWRRLPVLSGGLDLHPRVADVVVLPDRLSRPIEGPRGLSRPIEGPRGLSRPIEGPRGSSRPIEGPPGVLMAATGQGLLRSTDAGWSWSRHSLGVARAVTALAAVPGAPRAVLAATALGVYETRDAGATWTQVSHALADVVIHSLAFLPRSDSVLFATTPRGLFRSADRGRTWHRCGGGLPYSDITGLALHPDGRTAYASDFGRGGVFRSLDGGDTWAPLSTQGLASDRVFSLVLDPSSERLVAASPTGGLHLLSLDRPPGANAGAP